MKQGYSSVRIKLSDPAYSGFFLRFNPKNTTPYHVPPCDDNYSPAKCSRFCKSTRVGSMLQQSSSLFNDLDHDQEQTPRHPRGDGDCIAPCDCMYVLFNSPWSQSHHALCELGGAIPCGEYISIDAIRPLCAPCLIFINSLSCLTIEMVACSKIGS